MTMEAGADVQQGGSTAVSETDTQQIATLAQVSFLDHVYSKLLETHLLARQMPVVIRTALVIMHVTGFIFKSSSVLA